MNIQALISEKVDQAIIAMGIKENCKLQVCQSTKIQFGDYQINGIMVAAKKLNISSRYLARQILLHLDLVGIATKIEIAGLGFINIFLDPTFLAKYIDIAIKSDRLNIHQISHKTIVVVDYSSPNVAKEMHVGHLRSTIIGDSVVRTLEFLGYKVIRANHIGDWGTQFGMLIAWLEKKQQKNISKIALKDLENLYREAKKNYEEDKIFAEQSRNYVVKLQRGNKYLVNLWHKLVDVTISQNQIIYDRLNVTLTKKDIMGESLYNSMLPEVVADLKAKGLAVESKGAIVVFLDEFKNKKGEPMGVVIQKKDGGYLYTTTDIACAKYRYETLHANRIIYYIDSRQHQHLIQSWTIVRKAGYVPYSVALEHHMFGMVLGKDGKPFKTRSYGAIKLSELLDEALDRARHLITEKNPNLSTNELKKLANTIGIGALKYADLSKNRTTDYIFDWNNILIFEGNTAPYIQYAYTRILSVIRKSKINEHLLIKKKTFLREMQEIQLAVRILQFEEALTIVARNGTPNIMCSYLYNLSGVFSIFYEHCPILSTNNKVTRYSRLKLALLTAKTLKIGLETLGIEIIERM